MPRQGAAAPRRARRDQARVDASKAPIKAAVITGTCAIVAALIGGSALVGSKLAESSEDPPVSCTEEVFRLAELHEEYPDAADAIERGAIDWTIGDDCPTAEQVIDAIEASGSSSTTTATTNPP